MISQSTLSGKQDRIFKTALQLFVNNGFHGTPTSRIAAEAGVSNGTLFHYYKTKDALVVALYNRIKSELGAYLDLHINKNDSVEHRFRAIFMYSVSWGLEHPAEFHYIQQFHFSPHLAQLGAEAVEEQTRQHMELIGEALKKKLIVKLAPALVFSLVSSQVYGTYHFLAANRLTQVQRRKVILQSYEMIWKMLKA